MCPFAKPLSPEAVLKLLSYLSFEDHVAMMSADEWLEDVIVSLYQDAKVPLLRVEAFTKEGGACSTPQLITRLLSSTAGGRPARYSEMLLNGPGAATFFSDLAPLGTSLCANNVTNLTILDDGGDDDDDEKEKENAAWPSHFSPEFLPQLHTLRVRGRGSSNWVGSLFVGASTTKGSGGIASQLRLLEVSDSAKWPMIPADVDFRQLRRLELQGEGSCFWTCMSLRSSSELLSLTLEDTGKEGFYAIQEEEGDLNTPSLEELSLRGRGATLWLRELCEGFHSSLTRLTLVEDCASASWASQEGEETVEFFDFFRLEHVRMVGLGVARFFSEMLRDTRHSSIKSMRIRDPKGSFPVSAFCCLARTADGGRPAGGTGSGTTGGSSSSSSSKHQWFGNLSDLEIEGRGAARWFASIAPQCRDSLERLVVKEYGEAGWVMKRPDEGEEAEDCEEGANERGPLVMTRLKDAHVWGHDADLWARAVFANTKPTIHKPEEMQRGEEGAGGGGGEETAAAATVRPKKR
eukprot:GHVU01179277.1.p1 GENE.GHVU01179277.1~~GHVU01179277.1.p1  ORF type:complete len:520 (-),score=116.46 GHVU01179277.1:22-1581(-)